MGKVKVGKTGIKPSSASVPFLMSLLIFGRSVLYWYPNRNPSEEIIKTTGCLSFERGLEISVVRWSDGGGDAAEEKKRKANAIAVERETRVEIRRERNTTLVVVPCFAEEESDKRAAEDEFGSSSSINGIGFDSESGFMRFLKSG